MYMYLYKMFCQIPGTCFGSIIVLDISEYPMNFTAYDLSICNKQYYRVIFSLGRVF